MVELLTVREAAAQLRISAATAGRLVRAGGLPAVRVGRQWRVPVRALAEFEARATASPARDDD